MSDTRSRTECNCRLTRNRGHTSDCTALPTGTNEPDLCSLISIVEQSLRALSNGVKLITGSNFVGSPKATEPWLVETTPMSLFFLRGQTKLGTWKIKPARPRSCVAVFHQPVSNEWTKWPRINPPNPPYLVNKPFFQSLQKNEGNGAFSRKQLKQNKIRKRFYWNDFQAPTRVSIP